MNYLLSDEEILNGLKERNGRVTKEYFYEYCRIAYCIYDKRYHLRSKPGLDFFSLAHEYYLALSKHDFRQLEDRHLGMSLKTWMVNGFRFILLDRLKAIEKEHKMESLEERVEKANVRFDVADYDYRIECQKLIEDICMGLGRDNRNSILLQMMFVDGFKGKEAAQELGMSPSAVTQRYQRLMHDKVIPYFKRYYESGEGVYEASKPCMDMDAKEFLFRKATYSNSAVPPHRVTPDWIDHLEDNEVFVFGSNLDGMHGGGASRMARLRFGAVIGQGVGPHGQSYAIPTMVGGLDDIRPYIDDFIDYARTSPELHFFVTRIGCGIAGFEPSDIAPLFAEARNMPNVSLPRDFWEYIV